MKKIISTIQPFDIKQAVYVYEDGNKIDITSIDLENLSEHLLNKAKEYDIEDIYLVGANQYSKQIKNKCEEKELEKYNSNKIKINLI